MEFIAGINGIGFNGNFFDNFANVNVIIMLILSKPCTCMLYDFRIFRKPIVPHRSYDKIK